MVKASLLPQAQTPTYQNLSQFAQERSSGEMSEVWKSCISSSQMRLLGGTPHIHRQEQMLLLEIFFTLPPNGPSKMSSLQVLRGSKHFIHFNVVRSFTLHSPFKIVNFGHWGIVPCGEEIWYCNRPEILKINLVLLMVVDFKSMNDQITWMYEFTWPMDTWRSYWGMRHHDHASLQHFRVSFIIENIGT